MDRSVQKKLQTIRIIAREVRNHCERFTKRVAGDYISIEESDLGGLCAIASYTLRRELYKKSIDTKLIEGKWFKGPTDKWGWGHCWLEWNGYIIDITATQFGVARKVCINRDRGKHYGKRTPLRFKEWPDEQRPSDELAERIMSR